MKLYRYGALTSRLIQYFDDRSLFFQSPLRFNDPFDCDLSCLVIGPFDDRTAVFENYVGLLTTRLGEVIKKIQQLDARASDMFIDGEAVPRHYADIKHLYEAERAALSTELNVLANVSPQDKQRAVIDSWETKKRQVLAGLGVLCFTEANDQLLLWAHYADAHRGLCLEYDTAVRPVKDWKNYDFLPVRYGHDRQLDVLKLGWEQAFFSLITTKSPEWAYEREHRLISIKGPGYQAGTMASLTGIIFGLRIRETDGELRRCLLNSLQSMDRKRRSTQRMKFFSAQKAPHEFAIRVQALGGMKDVAAVLGL